MEETIRRIILKGYSIYIEESEDNLIVITVKSNPNSGRKIDVTVNKKLGVDGSIEDMLNDIYYMLV